MLALQLGDGGFLSKLQDHAANRRDNGSADASSQYGEYGCEGPTANVYCGDELTSCCRAKPQVPNNPQRTYSCRRQANDSEREGKSECAGTARY